MTRPPILTSRADSAKPSISRFKPSICASYVSRASTTFALKSSMVAISPKNGSTSSIVSTLVVGALEPLELEAVPPAPPAALEARFGSCLEEEEEVKAAALGLEMEGHSSKIPRARFGSVTVAT